jgi:hypothetical protein
VLRPELANWSPLVADVAMTANGLVEDLKPPLGRRPLRRSILLRTMRRTSGSRYANALIATLSLRNGSFSISHVSSKIIVARCEVS